MDRIESLLQTRAWPFIEAEKILKKLNNKIPPKGYVLFETGYGPSGLPHIGTFGEVVRTTMVRKAFEMMSDMPTRLFCFSDDMDGMRKIPDTIPNKEEYRKYMDLPLTSIPDPFGLHESFGNNMNARLRRFLDNFGFKYEFQSATEYYKKGLFNDALMHALRHYDEIMAIMLPTLGPERQATYSPFLPICQKTGKVLQVPVISRDEENGTITYKDLEGEICTTSVKDGQCKMQWKPDFGMRWYALDVDFEMYGKDHIVNGPIYTKICKVLGGPGPHQMFYELFLDEKGEKISKSKGNGLTIDEWLKYAPQESFALFMYVSPQKAKKLYFDVIPKNVDEYIMHLNAYHKEEDELKRLASPIHHIHHGKMLPAAVNISYSLLLNLVNACNTDNEEVVWRYVSKFCHNAKKGENSLLDSMIHGAINYYKDFVKPHLNFKTPSDKERAAILELANAIKDMHGEPAEKLQNKVYDIGMKNNFDLKEWFKALYEVLLGSSQGPRFGSFIEFYGIDETIRMINSKLNIHQ